MKSEYTRATHLVIDFFGCKNLEYNEEQMKSIVASTGCNFVEISSLNPLMIDLEEGYFIMTINKTYNYIAIDFYAGGDNTNPKLAIPLLCKLFKPTQESTRVLRRGIIS